jgi:2-polyprenyl-3-methyl-5-hydroxy-6-metoxy-1,4-benzoquinol methylase
MSIRQDPEDSEIKALLAFTGDLAGKKVLEIGCGDGRLTFRYAAQAALVHAIDPAAKKIARAQKRLPERLHGRVAFWAVGIEDFHPPEKYDLALLSWSL